MPRGETTLQIVVSGTYWLDVWIDRLAYQIDMLVYRPEFDRPDPQYHPLSRGELARIRSRKEPYLPGGP